MNFLSLWIYCNIYMCLLQIQDGYPSGRRLAFLCGGGLPTPVMSNTNVMYLWLHSMPDVTIGNQFNATWEAGWSVNCIAWLWPRSFSDTWENPARCPSLYDDWTTFMMSSVRMRRAVIFRVCCHCRYYPIVVWIVCNHCYCHFLLVESQWGCLN